ncbi:hypothetical protein C5167_048957 [Papaver somniferum]|uniref:Uncharacterized protein n=1 Tax=Papaver somniferum TaxID=3469 RepID=A0A4Y7KKU4_PAPSO|nr:hypothetical protein C5167_048957 [Papaver somniferum]
MEIAPVEKTLKLKKATIISLTSFDTLAKVLKDYLVALAPFNMKIRPHGASRRQSFKVHLCVLIPYY